MGLDGAPVDAWAEDLVVEALVEPVGIVRLHGNAGGTVGRTERAMLDCRSARDFPEAAWVVQCVLAQPLDAPCADVARHDNAKREAAIAGQRCAVHLQTTMHAERGQLQLLSRGARDTTSTDLVGEDDIAHHVPARSKGECGVSGSKLGQ